MKGFVGVGPSQNKDSVKRRFSDFIFRYSAEGCEGSNYRSHMVVERTGNENFELKSLIGRTAAINSIDSCSGYILLVKYFNH